MRCFIAGYLRSRQQIARGALGSVVIVGGLKNVGSDLILLEPKHGKRSVGGQARAFVDLLEANTGLPRDLPAAIDDRVGWRKRAMGGRLRPI